MGTVRTERQPTTTECSAYINEAFNPFEKLFQASNRTRPYDLAAPTYCQTEATRGKTKAKTSDPVQLNANIFRRGISAVGSNKRPLRFNGQV